MAMPALLLLPARLDQGRTWKGSAGRAQATGLLVRRFAELGVFFASSAGADCASPHISRLPPTAHQRAVLRWM